MPHITRNPTKDKCPPYDDEDHAAFREMAIAGHQAKFHSQKKRGRRKAEDRLTNAQDKKVT